MRFVRGVALQSALIVASLLLLLIGGACDSNGGRARASGETGDLAQVKRRGTLRIITPLRGGPALLPRGRSTMNLEQELVSNYAEAIGVRAEWVYVESRDELIDALLEGRGDVVTANLTVTPDRRIKVDFTVPVATVREQLVARADDPVADLDGLYGRRIAVRPSSSFHDTIDRLRERVERLKLEEIPENVDTEEAIHRVATGVYDLTVADSNLVEACLEYRGDIRPVLDLTGDRPIAWAVRPESGELLKSMNRYLTEAQLVAYDGRRHVEDLPSMKERRVLRMLTRNAAATYFLWRGELMGFEYELMRAFAKRNGMRLEVVVPPPGEDLLDWLRSGRGDVVAAALTPDESEVGILYSRPYNYVSQVVVAQSEGPELYGPADLSGRRVYAHGGSSHWRSLQRLRDLGLNVKLMPVPDEMSSEEVIALVADGMYGLAVVDSHALDIELGWRDDVEAKFAIRRDTPLVWAVRDTNPDLHSTIDEFVRREYRGLLYNVVYERYFKDPTTIRTAATRDPQDDLTPYDDIVKRYAQQYGFDWRLILSQMYQESRFDPQARSFAGAEGLMQVLPRTAEQLGFETLEDPDTAIHAGVKYLDWVRDRFEPELSVRDRMWFTLAGYNAGPGHVRDARRLADQLGYNPNRWFGNVEQAMLLLSRPKYAGQAPHGYCRCNEPVEYVREIRERYRAFVDALGS
ncbi:MAG: transporter substrate-binding domain-containing protein [bacterium]|nr:transporter substrate-binding domain-containing protein [bacterium]